MKYMKSFKLLCNGYRMRILDIELLNFQLMVSLPLGLQGSQNYCSLRKDKV